MIRRRLYQAARILGDLKAVKDGRIPERVVRRLIYKRAFKAANWVTRLLRVNR